MINGDNKITCDLGDFSSLVHIQNSQILKLGPFFIGFCDFLSYYAVTQANAIEDEKMNNFSEINF